jgi:hypothetical protein
MNKKEKEKKNRYFKNNYFLFGIIKFELKYMKINFFSY